MNEVEFSVVVGTICALVVGSLKTLIGEKANKYSFVFLLGVAVVGAVLTGFWFEDWSGRLLLNGVFIALNASGVREVFVSAKEKVTTQ